MRARGIGSLVQHTLQLVTQELQCIVTHYFLQLLVQQKLDLLPDTTPVKLKFLYTLTWPAFWRNFDSRMLSILVFSAMLDTSLSLSCSSPEIEKSAVLQKLQIWAFRAARNSRALSRKSGVNLLSTNLSDSLQYTRNISSHTSPWQLSLNKVSDTLFMGMDTFTGRKREQATQQNVWWQSQNSHSTTNNSVYDINESLMPHLYRTVQSERPTSASWEALGWFLCPHGLVLNIFCLYLLLYIIFITLDICLETKSYM